MSLLISFYIFMCKNGCGRWFHPTLVGVVVGLIMLTAGLSKFIAGDQMLTGVGSMALGIFDINNPEVAKILGTIAASIEVLGGIIFISGCRRAGHWAALFLAVVMAVALGARITGLQPAEGNAFNQFASALNVIRLDLLLFAIFVSRAWKGFCHRKCLCACSPEKIEEKKVA